MAYVIDRVDLLGYLVPYARVRDSTGTLVVRLSEAAACYLRETRPEGAGQPLTQWHSFCRRRYSLPLTVLSLFLSSRFKGSCTHGEIVSSKGLT